MRNTFLYSVCKGWKLLFPLFFLCCFGCSEDTNTKKEVPVARKVEKKASPFDWQGHRGSRGILPENTIPAFLKALDYKVKTLEMDAAISKDDQIIISHEPWFSAEISTKPDGSPIVPEEEKDHQIRQMTVAELQEYDVGSRGNERFPQQKKLKIQKPTLAEVIKAVTEHCAKNNYPLPFYNIEIKSRPEWDAILAPAPKTFATLLINEVKRLGIQKSTCIQSFDIRSLEAAHAIDPTLVTAYLIENVNPFEENMQLLSFTPTIYSPYYQLVTKELVQKTKAKGMQLIPWTVNEVKTMQLLKDLGVDGIITDYPNLIKQVE